MRSAKKINYNKEIVYLLYVSATILLILLTILNLENTQNKNKSVLGISNKIDVSELNKEKLFWEEVLFKTPTYFDGWMRLSEIQLMLGNTKEFENTIQNALKINPVY